MKYKLFNLKKRHFVVSNQYHNSLNTIIDDENFILGNACENLEKSLAKYLTTDSFTTLSNCTSALYFALKGLGITSGDEVIVTPMSYLATVSCIELVGATPKFVDVDDSLNLCPESIRISITKKTKAIIVVHLSGLPANIQSILSEADAHGIPVIEDCAQSFGGRSYGKALGTHGIAGCFSFHPLKILPALGDGGGITSQSKKLTEYCNQARNHGHKNREDVEFFSHNMRFDSLKAKFLQDFLPHLQSEIFIRGQNLSYYKEIISSSKLCRHIKFPQIHQADVLSLNFIMILADRRDELMLFLQSKGIETKIHYPLLLSKLKPLNGLVSANTHPNATEKVKKILTVPFASHITSNDIQEICMQMELFYSKDI